jgi:MYXO-CTERM domain-containing protein
MKMSLTAAALTIVCAGAPVARADVVIPVDFAGIVDDGTYTDSGPVNTSFVAGQPIAGSFAFDATTSTFLSFQIGGYTAAPGYTSVFSPPLASTSLVYLGVQNQVPNAAPADRLQINLYYETAPGPSTVNIAGFIGNVGQFSQDLTSGSPSYFAAYLTNADGSVTQVDGLLTSFVAPEPASLLIALPALAGLGLIRRRRG